MPEGARTETRPASAGTMPRGSARGVKAVPQRTCIACRTTGDKRALVRVVRGPTGVEVDRTGRKPGRGAYLCERPECWREALKKNRLDSALKTRLSQDEKLRLAEFVSSMNAVTA